MRKTLASCALITLALCGGGAALAAEPSLHEVYQAADSGHVEQAQRMMQNVLQAHPDSAKAHYVEAELLARQGQITQARSELARAEQLAPGLPFATPQSRTQLEQSLHRGTPATVTSPAVVANAPVTGGSSFPWGWLVGGLGLLAAFIFFLRSLNQRQATQASTFPGGAAPYGGPTAYRGPQPLPPTPGTSSTPGGGVPGYPQPGYGYPQAPAPAAGGLGSQMLGGLATGAAVGVGVAAGEALMHRWLDDRPHGGAVEPVVLPQQETVYVADNNRDLGGNDFGVSDSGGWDDSASNSGSDWT